MRVAATGRVGPLRQLVGYASRPRRQRALARAALVQLLRAWALVRLRPFRAYAADLGTPSAGDADWDWSGDLRLLVEVRWAVERWTGASGGRFTCLMKAMAGQELLARRGIASAVVLGVRPGALDDDPTAHAWLRVGSHVVLGGAERAGHIPVASYRRAPAGST